MLLGMGVDEAEAAMAAWGTPERLNVPQGAPPQLFARDEGLDLSVMAHFEDGTSVTAIEFMRPDRGEVTVVWDGIDIFGLSDEDVLAELRRRGVTVDDSDLDYPTCPDVTLGFDRGNDRGHFESVLVAKPGYYTADLPGIYLPITDPNRPLG